MHINRSALSKQLRVQHYAAANDAFDFFNMLTSPDLLDTLEASLPGMDTLSCKTPEKAKGVRL